MKPILTAVTDLEPTEGSGGTVPTSRGLTQLPRLQRAGLASVCGASGLGSLQDEPKGPAGEELAASDIK